MADCRCGLPHRKALRARVRTAGLEWFRFAHLRTAAQQSEWPDLLQGRMRQARLRRQRCLQARQGWLWRHPAPGQAAAALPGEHHSLTGDGSPLSGEKRPAGSGARRLREEEPGARLPPAVSCPGRSQQAATPRVSRPLTPGWTANSRRPGMAFPVRYRSRSWDTMLAGAPKGPGFFLADRSPATAPSRNYRPFHQSN